MTFLTFNKFVNEEIDKFFEESDQHGSFKVPIDIESKNYDYQKNSFVVKPKVKKTKVKKKKLWTGTNKGNELF